MSKTDIEKAKEIQDFCIEHEDRVYQDLHEAQNGKKRSEAKPCAGVKGPTLHYRGEGYGKQGSVAGSE